MHSDAKLKVMSALIRNPYFQRDYNVGIKIPSRLKLGTQGLSAKASFFKPNFGEESVCAWGSFKVVSLEREREREKERGSSLHAN